MIYGAMKVAIGGPLKLAFRPWVEGLENVPAEGPAILASNHLSFSDSFFLPAVLDRKVTFIAKAEYFTSPGREGQADGRLLQGRRPAARWTAPAARGAGEAAIKSGIEVLERGELFGIYPEGTRSPDGRLYRGKPGGLARVALATGAPVLPVAMIDTEKIQPPGKVMPKLMRPGIRIGKPLDFSRYQGMEHDRFVLRAVTDEVMYEIMKLSGQEYVDDVRDGGQAPDRRGGEGREGSGEEGREGSRRRRRRRGRRNGPARSRVVQGSGERVP